jgi:hypothetical protein
LSRLFHVATPAANLQQNLPVWLQPVGKNIVKPHGLSVVFTRASSLSLNMPGERGDFRIIIERVPALAVELVGEGQDRHVAQPAHLEEFARLLLDAPLAPPGAASSTITALSTAVRVR